MIDRQELVSNPNFATNVDRLAHLDSLVVELESALQSQTVDEWVARFLAAGIPAGPILDYSQVFDAPHTQARRMVEVVSHPVEGGIRTLGIPVKLSDTPGSVRRAPPLLGEHTSDVLTALAAHRSPWLGEGT